MIRNVLIGLSALAAIGIVWSIAAGNLGKGRVWSLPIGELRSLNVALTVWSVEVRYSTPRSAQLPHFRRSWRGAGFGRSETYISAGAEYEYVTTDYLVFCPSWLATILLAVYPTITFVRGPFRRWRRRWKGLCPDCAYDLTGNESGVCPECGKAIC